MTLKILLSRLQPSGSTPPKLPTSSFGSPCEEVACFYPGRHGDEHRHTHRDTQSCHLLHQDFTWDTLAPLPPHTELLSAPELLIWKYGPGKSVLPAVFTVSRDEEVAAKGKEDHLLNSVSHANHRHPFFPLLPPQGAAWKRREPQQG